MFLFIASAFSAIFGDSIPYENYNDYVPTRRFADFEAEAKNSINERRYGRDIYPRTLRKFYTHGYSNHYIGN